MQKSNSVHIVFTALFLLMIMAPLVTINLKENTVSEAENRYLAPKAKIRSEDGRINTHFMTDFETWVNDNIGFRSQMVVSNARLQYSLFKVLSNNSDMYLGPNGELNYATEAMLTDYQHNNLYDQDYLRLYAQSMQTVCDYVETHGSRFYYYQCWDKHSIYPEQFPTSVVQHGDVSKTDLLVKALNDQTTVSIVSPKAELIKAKEEYTTYSRWGDPSHWTMRGAIIGYNTLLEAMNTREGTNYHLLTEDDFIITITDQGSTLFGGIHEIDSLESFEFVNQQFTNVNEKLTLFADDPRSAYYENPKAAYDKTVLLVADSYFASYCFWDFIYSFNTVILIHADHVEDLPAILEAYPSDYVVLERAERVDSSQSIINLAKRIHELDHPSMTFNASDLYADEEQESKEYIIIHPGHVQFGPYVPIEKGKYRIVVHGKGMEYLTEECIYINPNSWYGVSPENVIIRADQVEYTVQFADELYKLELGIRNLTEETIFIERIEVFRAF